MPGRLTTHVLDIARGRPAAGITLELARLDENSGRRVLKTARTNHDERTGEPLLEEEEFERGVYEITFHVGEYFGEESDPPFLDRVPVCFAISDPTAHYHIPLLASPWSYSTYRGADERRDNHHYGALYALRRGRGLVGVDDKDFRLVGLLSSISMRTVRLKG